MVQITGKYQHERNENIDEYFRALGVPFIGRKMMTVSSPVMEITKTDDDVWTIKTASLLRTVSTQFKLNEKYDEVMPGGPLKTTSVLDGNKLISTSEAEDGTKITRSYEFDDTHCIITLTHEKSGQIAKRFFKRQ